MMDFIMATIKATIKATIEAIDSSMVAIRDMAFVMPEAITMLRAMAMPKATI